MCGAEPVFWTDTPGGASCRVRKGFRDRRCSGNPTLRGLHVRSPERNDPFPTSMKTRGRSSPGTSPPGDPGTSRQHERLRGGECRHALARWKADRGFRAVAAFSGGGPRGAAGLRHDVQEVLVSGTAAAARIVVTGIHAGPFLRIGANGAVVRVEQALFTRVASSIITELWEVVDTGSGLRQLGVLGDKAAQSLTSTAMPGGSESHDAASRPLALANGLAGRPPRRCGAAARPPRTAGSQSE